MVNFSGFHSVRDFSIKIGKSICFPFLSGEFIHFLWDVIDSFWPAQKIGKKGECCRGDKGNNKHSTNAESGSVIYALLTIMLLGR